MQLCESSPVSKRKEARQQHWGCGTYGRARHETQLIFKRTSTLSITFLPYRAVLTHQKTHVSYWPQEN